MFIFLNVYNYIFKNIYNKKFICIITNSMQEILQLYNDKKLNTRASNIFKKMRNKFIFITKIKIILFKVQN